MDKMDFHRVIYPIQAVLRGRMEMELLHGVGIVGSSIEGTGRLGRRKFDRIAEVLDRTGGIGIVYLREKSQLVGHDTIERRVESDGQRLN